MFFSITLVSIALLVITEAGFKKGISKNVPNGTIDYNSHRPSEIRRISMLDGRIVGGTLVSIEDFPYQVSVVHRGNHICGGSIIHPRAILTAAHCTDGINRLQLYIQVGSSNHNLGTRFNIQSICQHSKYNATTVDNDVSVLILAWELNFSHSIQPINLQNIFETVDTGALATVTGWGRLTSDGPIPNQLHAVDVRKVSDDYCKMSYGLYKITLGMTCFGYPEGGRDSCQGDSGGPLVYFGKQVGIASWGRGCALAGYPGVYTNLAAFSIAKHISDCLSQI